MQLISENPIGIFDSGIGGLTVVKRTDEFLPDENIIYFGDTARVPYGTKSNSTVIEYALQDAAFLMRSNIKMLIVACNTASSVAIPAIEDKFNIPVIGVIKPGAEMALNNSKNGRIGVIGTNATINNKAYSTELLNLDPDLKVFEKACPLFVPLAEEGWTDHRASFLIAEEYLAELKKENVDTLILGCTHYPILTNVIQKVMGDDVKLIDSGTASAVVLKKYLVKNGLINKSESRGRHEYYVSDISTKFREVAEMFLGRPVEKIEKIDLEQLSGIIV